MKSRKAQIGVMVAIGGLVFGLIISPIPNLASEYVMGNVLNRMEYHMSRQEAALDAVQVTSSPYFINFNPSRSYVRSKIKSTECNTTIVPGGNRIVRVDDDIGISHNNGCQFYYQSSTHYTYGVYTQQYQYYAQKAAMGNPPRISFYTSDSEAANSADEKRPNGILLSVQGGSN